MSLAYKLNNDSDKDIRYTYADYLTWDDDIRYELIDGVPYMMAAPSIRHQEISGEIFGLLREFLKGKPCRVLHAPVDVRLKAHRKDDTVVQPDVIIVCNSKKIENGKSCIGAPDMVVEVLSPSTRYRDYLVKEKKYAEAGVPEYWIVDPEAEAVQQLILNDGVYDVTPYKSGDTIPIHILPGCEINLTSIFASAIMPD
jgi:Uma2 family endonuclease